MENTSKTIFLAGSSTWPHLILNRPRKANALDHCMLHTMAEHFQKWQDTPPHGISLLACGKHFSSGADLGDMYDSGQKTTTKNHNDTKNLARLLKLMDACPCPIITAAQGAIMGGAIGLLALSDFILLAPSSYLAFNEINLGLMPAMIAPYVVRRIGRSKAKRYFMTGQHLLADEAKAIGLCDAIEPNLMEASVKLENTLRQKPKTALHAIKSHVKQLDHVHVNMTENTKILATMRQSESAQNRLKAFLGKQGK